MGKSRCLSPFMMSLVVILALLQVFRAQADATSSSVLSSSRLCMLAGGVIDLYSQNEGNPHCLLNGVCPAGAVQQNQQCVAPVNDIEAREIGITMQLSCDSNCMKNEGVDEAATIWFAIARLLRVPMQETHAALLIMSKELREAHPLDYFVLHIQGEDRLQTATGMGTTSTENWDIFLAIRIQTARIGAAANELRQLISGDIGNVARLSGALPQTMHIFDIEERRTPGQVKSLDGVQPHFRVRGYGWNERPSNGPAPSPPPGYAGAPPPAYEAPPPSYNAPSPSTYAPTAAPTTPQITAGPDECAPGCKHSMIQDGRCDIECQTAGCNSDGGDCIDARVTATVDMDPKLPGCGCESKWLGNGICETFCNYDACNFDGGDCSYSYSATNAPLAPVPAPAPRPQPTPAPPACGCNAKWVGDGVCDTYCNTQGCDYDGGDCPRPYGAPPAPTPPAPTPRPASLPSAGVPAAAVPAPAPQPAPLPAAAPSPGPSSTALRGSQAPTASSSALQQGTQVVDFSVQGNSQTSSSGGADAWRIVATHADGSTAYADDSSSSEEDNSPVMTAAIIAIFFAATGLLAVTAICVLIARTKAGPAGLRLEKKGSVRQSCTPPPPKVVMESCTPNPSNEAFKRQSSSATVGSKAKANKVPKDAPPGRRASKESVTSKDSMSTTSTETPPSNGTPPSSRSAENDPTPGRRREKEAKVWPEPDPEAPPPAPPPMPAWHRQNSSSPSEPSQSPQRRYSQPAGMERSASKERSTSHEARWQEAFQVPPPPMPNLQSGGSPQRSAAESSTSQASSAQTRRASEPGVMRQDSKPKVEPRVEPKPASKAAPKAAPKVEKVPSDGPRAAGTAQAATARSKQKAANSAKYSGWSFGRSATATAASAAPSEPTARAEPQRSHSSPPSGSKASWFGGSGPAAAEKATQKKASSLSADMMNQLDNAQDKSADDRKKIFKDLQRQLHPDKNIDQADAAKQAFQKLMEQRESFLAG